MGRLRWLCLLSLVLLLQACGSLGSLPPQAVVERGVAMKIAKTQQALIDHLAPKVPQLPNFKLRHVEVTQRDTQDDDVFHVEGTYQAIMQLSSQEKTDSGVFDIYLAREKTADTVSWFWVSDDHRELLVTNPA